MSEDEKHKRRVQRVQFALSLAARAAFIERESALRHHKAVTEDPSELHLAAAEAFIRKFG